MFRRVAGCTEAGSQQTRLNRQSTGTETVNQQKSAHDVSPSPWYSQQQNSVLQPPERPRRTTRSLIRTTRNILFPGLTHVQRPASRLPHQLLNVTEPRVVRSQVLQPHVQPEPPIVPARRAVDNKHSIDGKSKD